MKKTTWLLAWSFYTPFQVKNKKMKLWSEAVDEEQVGDNLSTAVRELL
jgi:hypothetical protein